MHLRVPLCVCLVFVQGENCFSGVIDGPIEPIASLGTTGIIGDMNSMIQVLPTAGPSIYGYILSLAIQMFCSIVEAGKGIASPYLPIRSLLVLLCRCMTVAS